MFTNFYNCIQINKLCNTVLGESYFLRFDHMLRFNRFLELYLELYNYLSGIWDKVFKNGPSNICGRQPLKNFTSSILEYFVLYVTLMICIKF